MESAVLQEFVPQPHPLKEIFYRHRVSQHLLARAAGVSQQAISLYLNGYRPLSQEAEGKLKGLADRLHGSFK